MSLLDYIKKVDEDYEWYPTTSEMLQVVVNDIENSPVVSHRYRDMQGILDVGADDGRVLEYFREHLDSEGVAKYLAIEKSHALARQWPDHIFPVGTDFHAQSLIDKPVRFLFCNPPYSEYKQWFKRIVREGFFLAGYLVVPSRWKESVEIQRALDSRGLTATPLWDGDFLSADRSARAKVQVVKLAKVRSGYDRFCGHCEEMDADDPFDEWFDQHFGFNESEEAFSGKSSESLKDRALVNGKNLVEGLVALYRDELQRLHDSYQAISCLEVKTLEDIGVSKEKVRGALREKISGLKNQYWREVFDNLDRVTSRLTSKSRERMLEKLMLAGNVDFDESNVYSVLIWVVKNANRYFDDQLVALFRDLSNPKTARPYVSNRHFTEGTWRSFRSWDLWNDKAGAYALDYRIVKEGNYYGGDYSTWGAEKRRHDLLQDIMTVANNLGFRISSFDFYNSDWCGGEVRDFFYEEDGELKPLMHVRLYKNGNLHLKINQRFVAYLNIEAGRLLGWLTSPKQAEQETGIKPEGWKAQYKIEAQELLALAA